jgi:O-antigen/teichoic acid export membrane protein
LLNFHLIVQVHLILKADLIKYMLINKIKKSEYARNSSILMIGTTTSMIIQVLSTLLYARIFTDVEFGIFTLFTATYTILLIAATGRYELAIMLPEEDNQGFMLTIIACLFSVCFGLVLALVLFVYMIFVGEYIIWLLFVPLALPILGVYYSANYWLNRKKHYKKLATNRVLQSILMLLFTYFFGSILNIKSYGLILGYIMAQFVVMLILLVYLYKDYKRFEIKISLKQIYSTGVRYKRFLLLSMPSGLINNFATQTPVFLLGFLTNNAVVGQYGMMNRVLATPISVIGQSITDVFRQRVSSDYAKNKECFKTYKQTAKMLAVLAIVPFILLMIFSKPLFNLIFGASWNLGASLITVMAPFYYIRFVISPLTYMTYVAEKQAFEFKWQSGFLIISIISFFIGSLVSTNPLILLIGYGIATSIMYFIHLNYTIKLAKGTK